MRKIIFFYAILFLGGTMLFAQNAPTASESDLIATYTKQAVDFYNAQDYDNAIAYFEKTLKIYKETVGENHADTALMYNNIGTIYCAKENYDAALIYYEKSLKIIETVLDKQHPYLCSTYQNIGYAYLFNEDYDTSLAHYEKALSVALSAFGEMHIETATCYEYISIIYEHLGDYENSLAYCKKEVAIKELLLKDTLELCQSYDALIGLCTYFGNWDTALEYELKNLKIRENVLGKNNIDIAIRYFSIAKIYYSKANYDKALEYAEAAVKISEESSEENNNSPDFYHLIGVIYNAKGDYTKALKYEEKSLEEENGSYAYTTIGLIYSNIGDYDKALVTYENALLAAKNESGEDSPTIASIYNNIGVVYVDMGKLNDALEYFEKSSAIFIKNYGELHSDTALNYNNIGFIYFKKKSYETALHYYKKALSIFEQLFGDSHVHIATTDNNIGLLYDEMGDYDSALLYYKKALTICENILGEKHFDTAQTLNHIGSVYQKQNDGIKAIYYWKKSQQGLSLSHYDKSIELFSSQLFSQLPDPSFTRETLTLATDTVERARLDLASLKDDILRKSLPIYYYGVQFEAEQKNPKKAFEYSESLRCRGFLDQIGTEAALKLDGVTESEREQIHSLTAEIAYQRKIIEEENARTLSERDEKRLSEAGKKLSDVEKSLSSLDKKIAKRIPAYAQLRNPVPVTASEAQKWCGKKRAVLEYVLWNPELSDNKDAAIKSYCIVLTKKKVSVVELDGSYDYAAAIDKLRSGIMGMKRESQFEAVRNELYEKLLSPVLPYVAGGTKELVIVPDGNLSFLPFDVLRKDADSKVLGDKYAVAFSPSVSVSVISGGKKTGGKNMLAFGGAWYDTKLSPGQHRANFTSEGISRGAKRGSQGIDFELTAENDAQRSFMKNDIQKNGPKEYFRAKNLVWQDLPGTITELNALKDGVFKSDSFSQIVQEEASERTVKRLSQEGKLAQYPILHFACHGYFDNKIADMSSVLFSEVSLALEGSSDDDGYLTIPETAVLKLNADLVCLSACETGLGKIKAGDGMVGLSRAFMVAGAESVGVSLWCVDDEATAKFMAAMYEKAVKKGMDYVSAYQKTKAEFRKDEDFDHPYYWAAFMLYE